MTDTKKLSQLQKMIDDINFEQNEIANKLAELRKQGKEKTVDFKQLFTKKMSNLNFLCLLEDYSLL